MFQSLATTTVYLTSSLHRLNLLLYETFTSFHDMDANCHQNISWTTISQICLTKTTDHFRWIVTRVWGWVLGWGWFVGGGWWAFQYNDGLSDDRLILVMEIPILVRRHLFYRDGPSHISIMIFIMIAMTIIGIFMAIHCFLNYTLGFL